MVYGPDDEEKPAGYYSTVSRPNPGASLPAPPGPTSRRVSTLFGALMLLGGVILAAYLVLGLINDPPPRDSGFAMGRYVAAVAAPVPLMVLGYILVRHSGDAPQGVLRRDRRARRRIAD